MKKIIAIVLALSMLISACGSTSTNAEKKEEPVSAASDVEESRTEEETSIKEHETTEEVVREDSTYDDYSADIFETYTGNAKSLNDETLLRFIEDSVYYDLVQQLDSDDYFVNSIEAVYISREYLDELEYNSKSNIFFGYTLAELDEQFQGTKYIFTLDENGETTVVPFEEYYDNTFDTVIRNVAIGTGVILVCVSVSVLTAGAAPAVSLVFAASAKTGAICALSGGAISGAAAAVVTGIQTGDVEESLKAAALAGSTGYMMGAISGALSGGASKTKELYTIAKDSGLNMNQVAVIQRESKYPAEIIKQFRNMDEYDVYKNTAKLKPQMVDNKMALVKDIDINYVDPESGLTNLERMKKGLAALDPSTGQAYELHHVGQNMDSPLAILTKAEHDMKGLHVIEESRIDRNAFNIIRKKFWKSMAAQLGGV